MSRHSRSRRLSFGASAPLDDFFIVPVMLEIQQSATYLAVRAGSCQDSAIRTAEGILHFAAPGNEPICFPPNLFRRGEVEGDVLYGPYPGLESQQIEADRFEGRHDLRHPRIDLLPRRPEIDDERFLLRF